MDFNQNPVQNTVHAANLHAMGEYVDAELDRLEQAGEKDQSNDPYVVGMFRETGSEAAKVTVSGSRADIIFALGSIAAHVGLSPFEIAAAIETAMRGVRS